MISAKKLFDTKVFPSTLGVQHTDTCFRISLIVGNSIKEMPIDNDRFIEDKMLGFLWVTQTTVYQKRPKKVVK